LARISTNVSKLHQLNTSSNCSSYETEEFKQAYAAETDSD